MPDGWDLTGITCDDDNSSGDIETATATFNVDPGETVTCTFENTQRGQIIIEKSVDSNDPGAGVAPFTFDTSYYLDSFSLTDGGQDNSGYLVPGIYSVSESALEGWDLTDVICFDGSDPSSISLSAGETVTCTFENTQRGQIIVEKMVISEDPGAGSVSFTFNTSYGLGSFSLTDGGQDDSGYLIPGTYLVSESALEGWDMTGVSCSDGSGPANIELAVGEVVTCTFENTQRGQIIVEKTVIDDDPGAGDILFTFNTSYYLDSFSLKDGESDSSGYLVPGGYSVSESALEGWDQTSVCCSDDSGPGSIDLSPGEVVTCTFENTQRGQIIVEKTVVSDDPAAGDVPFTFTTNYDVESFALTGGDADRSGHLIPGAYSVSESALEGWDLTGVICTDGSEPGNIELGAGEVVTCTFENTQRGQIIVAKTVFSNDPEASDVLFSFDASYYVESFSLNDGGSDNSGYLVPGNYSVSESALEGWDQTGVNCSGGSNPGNIELGAGEVVTCTFENTQRGQIIVEKTVVSDDPGAGEVEFTFNTSYDADSLALTDGASDNSGHLIPGVYSVSESALGGWDLTGVNCSDGSDPASIDVAAGETVACTFENTQRGQIIVEKVVVSDYPGAGDVTFTFSTSYDADSFSLTGGGSDNSGHLIPGVYSVSESALEGWDLTGVSCSDGSGPGSIDLAAGETVTCTFENTQRGKILIDKVTVPGDDPQLFDFTLSGGLDSINQEFSLHNGDPAYDSGFLRSGSGYSVSQDLPAGWEPTVPECTSSTGTSTAVGDILPSASIDLAPGDTLICVFNNIKYGEIVVAVKTVPAGDLSPFEFTGDAAGTISSADTISVSVPVGAYTSTEADPTPFFDLASIECDDDNSSGNVGSRTATFNVEAGETVTCTFSNYKRGTIIIEKAVSGPIPTHFAQLFNFTLNGPTGSENFQLAQIPPVEETDPPNSITFPNIPAGNYSVSESSPEGWVMVDVTCDNGNGPVSPIDLGPGETVSCVVTNKMQLYFGSQGFWRNWSNHYAASEFDKLIQWVIYHNPEVYADPDLDRGIVAGIFDFGGGSSDDQVLAKLTAVKMNLAATGTDMQQHYDLYTNCMVNVSTINGAAAVFPGEMATVGDVVAFIESEWNGDLDDGMASFGVSGLNDSQKSLIAQVLDSIYKAELVVIDPLTYPNSPACLLQLEISPVGGPLGGAVGAATVDDGAPNSLPESTVGIPYSMTFEATGGTPPYTWSIVLGGLPTGLSIDSATGEINGTPLAEGTEDFTVQVEDSVGVTDSMEVSITINAPPVITTTTLPDATTGVEYGAALEMTGRNPLSHLECRLRVSPGRFEPESILRRDIRCADGLRRRRIHRNVDRRRCGGGHPGL